MIKGSPDSHESQVRQLGFQLAECAFFNLWFLEPAMWCPHPTYLEISQRNGCTGFYPGSQLLKQPLSFGLKEGLPQDG